MVEAAKVGATEVADAGSAKDSFERQSKIRLAFFYGIQTIVALTTRSVVVRTTTLRVVFCSIGEKTAQYEFSKPLRFGTSCF